MLLKKVVPFLLLALTLFLCARFFSSFSGASAQQVFGLIATIPTPVCLALTALTCVFYLLDWIRFRSVLQVLGYRLRLPDGLRLTCVSYFVTSLTPTAELHTPAMVYMLGQQQVPVPDALAASVTKSIYMTLWICLVAYLSLFFDKAIALPPALRTVLPYLALPLLGIALLLAAIAFFPAPVLAWSARKASASASGSPLHAIAAGIGHSAAAITRVGTSRQSAHWVCHVASIAFLLTYVVIGAVLASCFGFQLGALHALTVFSTSLMIAYLSPVPGSIGVTEVATSYMLDPALTPQGMAVSLTLRILCWYLVAAPGGLLLALAFHKQGARWSLPKVFK